MKFDEIRFQHISKKTGRTLDLFSNAHEIKAEHGIDRYGQFVAEVLDKIEQNMSAGVVYYDKRGVILHDRAAILEALHRDHAIARSHTLMDKRGFEH